MDSLTYRHNFLKESLLSSVSNLPRRIRNATLMKHSARSFLEEIKVSAVFVESNVIGTTGKQIILFLGGKGGKTEIENGQVLCPSCNSKKSDKTVGV